MNVISMIEDYRLLCEEAGELGKFEAYRRYTRKYPVLFGGVFRYLYCCPVEALESYIGNIDFERLLRQARENYGKGICEAILAVAEQSAKQLQADFEFDLMLGLEMANIGGCSLPVEDAIPYLYIGIDRELTEEFVRIFVPHEMYHMIRCRKAAQPEQETLFTRAVEEGLASYAPMWINGMPWDAGSIALALGIQVPQAEYLLQNAEQIVESNMARGGEPLTREVMEEYFVVKDGAWNPALPGYFTGLYLTELSVRNGVDFGVYLTMTAGEIAAFWQEHYHNWK